MTHLIVTYGVFIYNPLNSRLGQAHETLLVPSS